jgi:hypothetical protein
MDASAWTIISIIGYSLAGVLFITAIILFFKMNIPSIIGDLSGKKAAKQIQMIREQNTSVSKRRHIPDAFNMGREEALGPRKAKTGRMGKTDQAIAHQSKLLGKKGRTEESLPPLTIETLATGGLRGQTNQFPECDATTVLSEETTALSDAAMVLSEETTALSKGTAVLLDGTTALSDATTVLSDETTILSDATTALSDETTILSDVTTALSDETIILSDATTALSDETTILSDATTVLNETVVLAQENGTTVLNPTAELENEEPPRIHPVTFKIIKDIKITHTNEVI